MTARADVGAAIKTYLYYCSQLQSQTFGLRNSNTTREAIQLAGELAGWRAGRDCFEGSWRVFRPGWRPWRVATAGGILAGLAWLAGVRHVRVILLMVVCSGSLSLYSILSISWLLHSIFYRVKYGIGLLELHARRMVCDYCTHHVRQSRARDAKQIRLRSPKGCPERWLVGTQRTRIIHSQMQGCPQPCSPP
jgi:hypothetical protein